MAGAETSRNACISICEATPHKKAEPREALSRLHAIIETKGAQMEAENYKFYKQNDTDTIWWIGTAGSKGEYLFAFDKVKIYNLFRDYPYELAPEQIAIFKKRKPVLGKIFPRQRTCQPSRNTIPNKR